MPAFIVVENPKRWPLDLSGAEVVAARDYLTDRRFVDIKRAHVFNLCRSYGYQTLGYYVSLLAAARGHKPLPSIATLQELRQSALIRVVAEDLNRRVQTSLGHLESDSFQLSIYFGRNLAARYDLLSQALFNFFPIPFLRADFVRTEQWRLNNLRVIAADDIPDSHRDFVVEQATRFFARPQVGEPVRWRYKLAILFDPDEVDSPSDEKAIRRFTKAANKLGFGTTIIGKQDYGRVAEFDALFIRETTRVNHHTYRFAVRAAAEGLVVIDDPESIVRCSNKVYQAELFARRDVPCPDSLVVHRDNVAEVGARLGFPCVLKRPDSAFSAGVAKVDDEESLGECLKEFFKDSELVIAQPFVPSSFDWRVGVLDGHALYVCKYHMARGHWQIRKLRGNEQSTYGRVEAMAVEDAPTPLLDIALRAANAIGRGFYGVDVKEVDGEFLVMEVNDNPNVEAGYEDAVLKDELYLAVMRAFRDRLDQHEPHDD